MILVLLNQILHKLTKVLFLRDLHLAVLLLLLLHVQYRAQELFNFSLLILGGHCLRINIMPTEMLEALISIRNDLLGWPLYILGRSLDQSLQIRGNTWHWSHIGIHQKLMLRW